MTQPRDVVHWQCLKDVLGAKTALPQAMNIDQLDGYLRAVASAPVVLPKSYWLELVFGEINTVFDSDTERELFHSALDALLVYHRNQVFVGDCTLLLESEFCADQTARQGIEQWARGFMQGYIIVEKEWNELLELCPQSTQSRFSDGEEQIDNNLLILSTVADAQFALNDGVSEQQVASRFACLPQALISMAQLGLALRAWMTENRPDIQRRFVDHSQPVVAENKVGRNAPCRCGSGKKFKKCCA